MTGNYWCGVSAWPGDLSREIYLGGYWATTPRLAVRWLRGQAARLAYALDPQPGEGWAQGEAVQGLIRMPDFLPDGWPDPGHALRRWLNDSQRHETVMDGLRIGRPFQLSVHDPSAYFMLSVQPFPDVLKSPREGKCVNWKAARCWPSDHRPLPDEARLSHTSRVTRQGAVLWPL
jgi:hypothetical protein